MCEDMEEAGVFHVDSCPPYDFVGEIGEGLGKLQIGRAGKKRRIGDAEMNDALSRFSAVDMSEKMSEASKTKTNPRVCTGHPRCDQQSLSSSDGHAGNESDATTDPESDGDDLPVADIDMRFAGSKQNSSKSFARRSPSPIHRPLQRSTRDQIREGEEYDDPLR
jgi:hypothetical protein